MAAKIDVQLPPQFVVGAEVVVIPYQLMDGARPGKVIKATKTQITVELDGPHGKYTRRFFQQKYRAYKDENFPQLLEYDNYSPARVVLPNDPAVEVHQTKHRQLRQNRELDREMKAFQHTKTAQQASRLIVLLQRFIEQENLHDGSS